MEKILTGIVVLIILFSVSSASAQDKGIIIKENFSIGKCLVKSMTVKFNVGASVGVPYVKGSYNWKAEEGTEVDCLPQNLVIWLRVESKRGGHGYLRIAPTHPKSGTGFGKPVSESPDWGAFICGYEGDKKIQCFSAGRAKAFYNNKMEVVDFRLSKE